MLKIVIVLRRSYPRTDFLQLAEYLEDHTAIDELRHGIEELMIVDFRFTP